MFELIIIAVVVGAAAVAPRVIVDALAMAKAATAGQWDHIDAERARRHERSQRRTAAAAALMARRRKRLANVAASTGADPPEPTSGWRAYRNECVADFWADRLARHRAKRARRGEGQDPTSLVERQARRTREIVIPAPGELVDRAAAAFRRRVADGQVAVPVTDGRKPAASQAKGPSTSNQPIKSGDADVTTPAATDGPRCPQCGELGDPGSHRCGPDGASDQPIATGGPMASQTAATATDMQTNDDARRSAAQLARDISTALDALSAYEAAKAAIKARALSTAEGMQAGGHDPAATLAASAAADAISPGDLAAEFGALEETRAGAEGIVRELSALLDAEDVAAARGVRDLRTLSRVNS